MAAETLPLAEAILAAALLHSRALRLQTTEEIRAEGTLETPLPQTNSLQGAGEGSGGSRLSHTARHGMAGQGVRSVEC